VQRRCERADQAGEGHWAENTVFQALPHHARGFVPVGMIQLINGSGLTTSAFKAQIHNTSPLAVREFDEHNPGDTVATSVSIQHRFSARIMSDAR
jgi:hypothetical protein